MGGCATPIGVGQRRRQLAGTRLAGGLLPVVLLMSAVLCAASGEARASGSPQAGLGAGAGARAGVSATAFPHGLGRAVAHYLRGRSGTVTVALFDVTSRRSWHYRPHDRRYTASIVKVDILEALLAREHGHLSAGQRALAVRMIEQSDNAAATALWGQIGGPAGLGSYNRRAGLTCTIPGPSGYWGLTSTCARDQVKLLRRLAVSNRLLRRSERAYELGLMSRVVRGQAWGVSGGVPQRVSVALKNGWLPHSDPYPWIVNSIGIIHGRGRRYILAVLTSSPSESYGIATIERVSALVWRHIPIRRHRHERDHHRKHGHQQA